MSPRGCVFGISDPGLVKKAFFKVPFHKKMTGGPGDDFLEIFEPPYGHFKKRRCILPTGVVPPRNDKYLFACRQPGPPLIFSDTEFDGFFILRPLGDSAAKKWSST